MKAIIISAMVIGLVWPARGSELVINELLASNDTTQADQNGDYDDWIEIYNQSGATIALSGYHLSDDPSDLTQWTFPDTSIGPHSFLIVWADEDVNQAGLHANFKISASGEGLYLTDDAAVDLDHLTFGAQATDVSTGRYPDGSGAFRAMYPSFGAPNNPRGPGDPDTTFAIFGDTLVHSFRLEFYTEHWQDSLQYNFEVLDQQYMPARLTCNQVVVLDSIGVRYKGNSSYEQSRSTPKKPFEFKLDKYREQSLMGIERLNLSNCVNDPSFMRETITYGLARRYGPASRTAYANLDVNGTLLGFYVVVEQVDKTMLGRYYEDNGGNLFKAGDDGATLEYHGNNPDAYAAEYELKTNEEENDWSGFFDLLNRLNNVSDEHFVDSISARLNIENCLKFLALNMVTSNFDSYTGSGRNFYFYDDRTTGRFQYIPWDFNESFGVYSNGFDVFTQDVVNIPNLPDRPLTRRLLGVDSLREIYINDIREIISGPAHPDSISALTAMLRPVIQSYVEADTNKLYTNQAFISNIESNVYVGIGHLIPGLNSFARIRTANLRLQTADHFVYPGDTDNNGTVNAQDILPIARYFLGAGPVRDSVALFWNPCRAVAWRETSATYADANGDGRVDERDVIAIGVNWQSTHANNSPSYVIEPRTIVPNSVEADHLRKLAAGLSGDSPAAQEIVAFISSIVGAPEAPLEFRLDQNYPNPFNQRTTITYSLPESRVVNLSVLNILGEVAASPVAAVWQPAGQYRISFDAHALASGVYFYRLQAGPSSQLRKMLLLR